MSALVTLNSSCVLVPGEPNSRYDQVGPRKRKADELIENLQRYNQSNEVSDEDDFELEPEVSETKLTQDLSKYVALDCEMVQTVRSSNALARCTIVSTNGTTIYDKYVKPYAKITDYRSQFSGVHPEHMKNATPFSVAQRQIRGVISGKYVVGHTVHRDFDSIGFDHPEDKVIDINKLAAVRQLLGLNANDKFSVSLKRMTKALFDVDIQTGEHCSYQDAWATMKIFLLSRNPSQIQHNVVLPPAEPKKRPYAMVATTNNDNERDTNLDRHVPLLKKVKQNNEDQDLSTQNYELNNPYDMYLADEYWL